MNNPPQILRLYPADADQLRWLLLSWYEGDCGMKSNWGDVVDSSTRVLGYNPIDDESWHTLLCHETRSRKPYDLGEDMLRAADELRQLLARWGSLGDRDREALRFMYGDVRRRDLPEWGERGPFVLRSAHARRAWERDDPHARLLLGAWLARVRTRANLAKVLHDLEEEADGRMEAACRAWERSAVIGLKVRRRSYPTRRRDAA